MISKEQREVYHNEIAGATNVSEVAYLWNISKRDVYRLIDEDKIYAVYVSGSIIISLGSCRDFLGLPKTEIKTVAPSCIPMRDSA